MFSKIKTALAKEVKATVNHVKYSAVTRSLESKITFNSKIVNVEEVIVEYLNNDIDRRNEVIVTTSKTLGELRAERADAKTEEVKVDREEAVPSTKETKETVVPVVEVVEVKPVVVSIPEVSIESNQSDKLNAISSFIRVISAIEPKAVILEPVVIEEVKAKPILTEPIVVVDVKAEPVIIEIPQPVYVDTLEYDHVQGVMSILHVCLKVNDFTRAYTSLNFYINEIRKIGMYSEETVNEFNNDMKTMIDEASYKYSIFN